MLVENLGRAKKPAVKLSFKILIYEKRKGKKMLHLSNTEHCFKLLLKIYDINLLVFDIAIILL